jgi:26S proteasome regulatory subunit N1
MLSATASTGFTLLWDVENYSKVELFTHSPQTPIVAGALLGMGLMSYGINNEMVAAAALLPDYFKNSKPEIKIASVLGFAFFFFSFCFPLPSLADDRVAVSSFGLAYAGSHREDLLEELTPLVADGNSTLEVVATACLAIGLIFAGSGNDEVFSTLLVPLTDRTQTETEAKDSSTRLICLSLGLLFLGLFLFLQLVFFPFLASSFLMLFVSLQARAMPLILAFKPPRPVSTSPSRNSWNSPCNRVLTLVLVRSIRFNLFW